CGEARAIERVTAHEPGNARKTLGADQRAALVHVDIAVVAEQDRVGRRRGAVERVENITAVSRCDVDDVDGRAGRACRRDRLAQDLLDVQFTLADAAPADRVKIVAIDYPSE